MSSAVSTAYPTATALPLESNSTTSMVSPGVQLEMTFAVPLVIEVPLYSEDAVPYAHLAAGFFLYARVSPAVSTVAVTFVSPALDVPTALERARKLGEYTARIATLRSTLWSYTILPWTALAPMYLPEPERSWM